MALRNANASAARIGWPLHVEKPSGRPVDVMSEQTREPIPVTEPMLETMLAGQETTAATPETTARLAETAPIEPPGASAEVVPFRLKSADQPPAPLESMAIAAERPRMERGPRFSPREASPVARVAADEFAPEGAPIKELRDASTAYYRAKLQARTVTNPDLGGITFTGRGLREMRYASANPDKLRLVAALPDILTKGRLVSSEAESKGKEGVVAYHRIGAHVEVGTKPLYAEVVVEERNDGKIYYNHFLAKDEASLRTVRIPGDKPGTDRTGEAPVVSDGQDLSDPSDDSLNIVPNDPTRKPQFSPRVMGENRSRDYASEQRQAFDGGGRTAEPLVIAAESPRAEGPQLSPRIEAEPVARVSEDELVPRGSDIRTLRQAAIDYFRTKLQGRTVTNADLGAITFTGRGRREMRHVAANPDKLRIVPLLAEILSKGRLIKSEPNYKDKQDVEAYHTLRAIARIGDRLVDVDALVEQRINGKIYYTHFAENEEASLRVASSPGTKTGTSQSGEAPGVIKAKDPADDALNIVPNDPTRKPQFSPRIKPRDLEQARQAVGDVFAEMQRGQVSSRAVSLGDVTQWLTDQAKAAGLDVAGFRHSIDVSAIRHIWKRHTNAKIEQARGQVPVTPEDLRRIPDVLVAPDYLVFGGKGGRGLDAIGYIKRLDDGSMLYFEERRSGRYELAALTFMKYPAGTRADAIANNLGLYVRSDGGRLNIVGAGGGSSAIQLPGPNDRPSFSPRQYGIPADAAAITTFKSDEGIKAHRDYKAAKAGDPAAAARLVSGLVRPEQVETARAKFGSDALYVPIVAEEATGHNAIPEFLARYYAEVTAADVARGIRQTVRAFHTGADAMGRLIARPAFEGPVERGRNYVIVDDVSVLGGTLAELANHIQAGGGRIAGVITLVNASRSGQYSPRRGHVALIERRFGNEIREAFGVEPGALTADEVQYLVNFKDADALRARRINAQGERERRLREKGVLPSEAQDEVRERDVEPDDKSQFSPRLAEQSRRRDDTLEQQQAFEHGGLTAEAPAEQPASVTEAMRGTVSASADIVPGKPEDKPAQSPRMARVAEMARALEALQVEQQRPGEAEVVRRVEGASLPEEIERGRSRPSFSPRPNRDTYPAEIMRELRAVDEMFRYPKAKPWNPEAALRAVLPGIQFKGDATRPDEPQESGANRRLMFRTPRGHDFYLLENDGEFWINIIQLHEGEGGSAIYAALMDWAAKTGRRFIGDPMALSNMGLRRRTEAMLSSAIKHGSTDHMEPHARQLAGDEALGVPPLAWRDGDTIANIQSLIDVSTASLVAKVPEIKDARYDFDSGTFRTGEGDPLSDRAIQEWADSLQDREVGAGPATLKRAIFLRSLQNLPDHERPKIVSWAQEYPNMLVEPAAKEIFYSPRVGDAPTSKSQSSPRDLEPARVIIDKVIEETRQGIVRGRAISFGDVPPEFAEEIKKSGGPDIAGYRHVIDVPAIHYIVGRHSDPAIERPRGQLTGAPEDLRRIPDILSAPDFVLLGAESNIKSNIGRDAIAYIKTLDDGSILHLEEQRSGRRQLVALSLRKYPAATRAGAIVSSLGLDVRNDGGPVWKVIQLDGRSSALQSIAPSGRAEFWARRWSSARIDFGRQLAHASRDAFVPNEGVASSRPIRGISTQADLDEETEDALWPGSVDAAAESENDAPSNFFGSAPHPPLRDDESAFSLRRSVDRQDRRAWRYSLGTARRLERDFNREIGIVTGNSSLTDEQRRVRIMHLNALKRRATQSLSIMEQ